MTTKITDKNISNIANKFIQWQSVITADGSTSTNATAGQGYFIDTTSATHTITLPSSPSIGDSIAVKDYAGTFATNNLTISRNGSNIQGVANDSAISSNRASLTLVYVDSTRGWVYSKESNVADLQGPLFITATGGTITTSGDYKIHTFTGDGCFVVSSLGNPVGGGAWASTVDYLVVAGGGGGGTNVPSSSTGGGGGGAGGFREGIVSAPVYTASPLVSSGLSVSATTYPVTVGGGGSGGPGSAASGSTSTFSTISSAGGGRGASYNQGYAGSAGGSGGGGAFSQGAGVGNSPPVSPPQGNQGGSGGAAAPSSRAGGGGGGATGNGNDDVPGQGGNGGNGATTNIIGSSTTYSGGGGGGGSNCNSQPTGGTGGPGGGGNGANAGGNNGSAGGTNSGGGGGGGGGSPPGGIGGAGGKGIVIIRYKYQ